ncbi:MAG: hypothetical protein JOZ10_01845 [Acidobacteria bacterium]|nr:hypothetical protein [Acidobacteriota bacterium]MBV9436499.1 hypothetical protein [Acidobacteriota bacterium]
MKKSWLLSSALLLAFPLAYGQNTNAASGTPQSPAVGSTGSSSTAAPSQSSNTTGGTDASGTNQGSVSQTGATGTSGNTSSVGSNSANVSTPSGNAQSSTAAGANNAYPTDQASTAGNDQLGAQARATGASTGVGVSAKPNKNRQTKENIPVSTAPQANPK